MFLTADMFRRSRNIKAHQPIAAAVDNRGDSLSDTSRVDPLVGKVILCTVCTACSSHLEAMRGNEGVSGNDDDEFSFSAFGMGGTGALPTLNDIWECPQINMSLFATRKFDKYAFECPSGTHLLYFQRRTQPTQFHHMLE